MKDENNLRKDSAGIGSLPAVSKQNKISKKSKSTTNLSSNSFSEPDSSETKKTPENTVRGRCHKY